jgi:hypothetical protein
VYGMAHMQTTTPKIVLAAFQITGYITPALWHQRWWPQVSRLQTRLLCQLYPPTPVWLLTKLIWEAASSTEPLLWKLR